MYKWSCSHTICDKDGYDIAPLWIVQSNPTQEHMTRGNENNMSDLSLAANVLLRINNVAQQRIGYKEVVQPKDKLRIATILQTKKNSKFLHPLYQWR